LEKNSTITQRKKEDLLAITPAVVVAVRVDVDDFQGI